MVMAGAAVAASWVTPAKASLEACSRSGKPSPALFAAYLGFDKDSRSRSGRWSARPEIGSAWHEGLAKKRKKNRIGFPVCLLQGLGGPFWDGGGAGDSNDPAPDHFSLKKGYSRKKGGMLLSLIQEIEPLDVSLISKDASADSMDAMKRTISGMLGLLPSDQFQVTVEAYREPLGRLLVSSMMTGYTLRNAEYRLCLQRSLELSEDDSRDSKQPRHAEHRSMDLFQDTSGDDMVEDGRPSVDSHEGHSNIMELEELPENLGPLSPEAANYIRGLQAKLLSSHKDLEECKRAKTALEMEKIVGDEKNDLLDYLRSLEPEKVAELSQPTSSEVEDVIQIVINDLVESLCSSPPSKSQNYLGGKNVIGSQWNHTGGSSEALGNIPLQYQSTLTAARDYLARLLFWCMLLGHHLRGVEYRLELSRALSISSSDFDPKDRL